MFSQFDDEEVEVYFHRLNAQLRRLPVPDRAELHQELRQHLDALIAAHEELGATSAEAVTAALRQFGDPADIGRRMRREWEKKTMRQTKTEWITALAVAAPQCVAVHAYFWDRVGADTRAASWWMLLLATPVIAGLVAGWFTPRSFWKTFSRGSLPPALLMLLAISQDLLLLRRDFLTPLEYQWLQNEALTFSLMWATWLPMSWASALAARRLRRNAGQRPAPTL